MVTDGSADALESVRRQQQEVQELNRELSGRIVLLHGVQICIGPNGEIDLAPALLRDVDFVAAAAEYTGREAADQVTQRLLKAIEHPIINMIRRPTGRQVGMRDPMPLDFDKICAAAASRSVALEIDADPDRLDLPDVYVRRAKGHGVRLAISTGARTHTDLMKMRYGVATAQRGWATPSEVINTWPVDQLRQFLSKR
jgi:DNA polymerase (family 10)